MQVETNTNALPTWASQQSGIENVQDRSQLMKDDFLKLLVTQLQYQDPLNPASNQEFAAQLAQFSSLEQLTQMNKSLESSLDSDAVLANTINNSLATGFLGKEVHALGDIVQLKQGESTTIRFSQTKASVDTLVNIYNTQGTLVRTLDLGPIQAGGFQTEWDGRDQDDTGLPSGNYSFEVQAYDPEGNGIDTATFMIGLVTGVRYLDNHATLLMGDREVPYENVIEIVDPQYGVE